MSEPEGRVQGLELRLDAGADADPEELEGLTARLRSELLELTEVEDVQRPPAAPPPPGSKAIGALAAGALVVRLVTRAGGVAAVVRAVQSWLASQPARTVKLELDGDVLEVSGVSAREQERLITAWIERHEGR